MNESKVLGRFARLYVSKITKFGVMLRSFEEKDLEVLLPNNQSRNHLSQRTQHQPLSILHRLLLFKPILLIPTTTSLHPSSFFPSNTSYSSILPPSINTLYSIINPSFYNCSTITILLHPFYHYYWNTTTSLRSTSLTHQTHNGF